MQWPRVVAAVLTIGLLRRSGFDAVRSRAPDGERRSLETRAAARRSNPLALARPQGQAGDEVSLEQDVDDQGRDDRESSARRDQVVVAEELPL